MGLAAYEIIGNDAEWRVRHGGKAETRPRKPLSKPRSRPLLLRYGRDTKSASPLPDGDLPAGLAKTKRGSA
jgi:hypothetical protein